MQRVHSATKNSDSSNHRANCTAAFHRLFCSKQSTVGTSLPYELPKKLVPISFGSAILRIHYGPIQNLEQFFIPTVNPEILRRSHSMCSCRTFLTLSCNRTYHGPSWLNRHTVCSQFHPPWEAHYPDSFALFSSAAPNAEQVP